MIRSRHDGAPAGFFDGGRNCFGVGRHHGLADLGLLRTPHHVHDHRQTMNVGERLAGKPGRGHAGGDQDKGLGHRVKPVNIGKTTGGPGAYTGCQTGSKPVSVRLASGCKAGAPPHCLSRFGSPDFQ